jgi:hypothetical protein
LPCLSKFSPSVSLTAVGSPDPSARTASVKRKVATRDKATAPNHMQRFLGCFVCRIHSDEQKLARPRILRKNGFKGPIIVLTAREFHSLQ